VDGVTLSLRLSQGLYARGGDATPTNLIES
jgi:hypothetical protein